MMRLASIVCGLLSIGLLASAGYFYLTEREPLPPPTLSVDDPERDLGEQPCETAIPVQFRLRNPSAQALRVISLVPG